MSEHIQLPLEIRLALHEQAYERVKEEGEATEEELERWERAIGQLTLELAAEDYYENFDQTKDGIS